MQISKTHKQYLNLFETQEITTNSTRFEQVEKDIQTNFHAPRYNRICFKFHPGTADERESDTRFSTSGFFHKSVSHGPLSISLGSFRFFSKIRGDIRE
jgi:hypothetical protein